MQTTVFKINHVRGTANDDDEQISEYTETDKNDDLDKESDAETRFSYQRTVPDKVPLRKKEMFQKVGLD